jgi:hypothetical protein
VGLNAQSGLRGLQVSHLKHFLDIPYNGYEFETEMLLKCSKNNIKIKEISIETIYKDNNSSSHFNPLLDSLKPSYAFSTTAFSASELGQNIETPPIIQ